MKNNFLFYLFFISTYTFGQNIITPTVISQSDFTQNSIPEVYGNKAVWQAFDGNDTEIFYFDGNTTFQITNNDFPDEKPKIWETYLVWQGFLDGDYEIFKYDGGLITQITNNTLNDINPDTYLRSYAWQTFDGNDYEIFFQNTKKRIIQFTNNNFDDVNPNSCFYGVVYEGFDGNDYELYRNNSPLPFTNNDFDDVSVISVFASMYWSSQDGDKQKIWHGVTTGQEFTPIFVANGNASPDETGDGLIFSSWDGEDDEIYTYNNVNNTIQQITDNSTNDNLPSKSGTEMVWVSLNGSSQQELWYFNGIKKLNLTTDILDNSQPVISSGYIFWIGKNGSINFFSTISLNNLFDMNPLVSVVLQPNPSNGIFEVNIESESDEKILEIRIMRIIGDFTTEYKAVTFSGNNTKESIDITGAPPALYLVLIRTNKGNYSKRLSIN